MHLYSKRSIKRLRSYSVACVAGVSLLGSIAQAQPVQQPIVQEPIVQQPIVQEPGLTNEPLPQPAQENLPVAEPSLPGPQRATEGSPAGDNVPAPPTPALPLIPDGASPPGPVAPAFPPALPNIDFGARMRIGVRLQDPTDPESFGDVSQQIDTDIYMGGAIHRMFKWQAGVTVSYSGNAGQPQTATVLPLDLLARFEPMPEFNIYLGRMIVIADRYVPSGPWGMDEFYFPGVFQGAAPAVQKSGATGRDVGANIWGTFMGGHIKYYLGAYQLHDPTLNPLLSGRLQVSLLSPEPAFYQRTTYYGTKDLVSIGVGGQYQADGSVQALPAAMPGAPPAMAPGVDDHSFFTADLTVDKKIGDAGTFSFTGGASIFGGDFRTYDSLFHAALGFTFPQVIGIGKLRPNVRFQQAQSHVEDSDASTFIDVQLSYLVMDWFTRVSIGYRRSSIAGAPGTDNTDGNMLTLGVILADP